jgi:hypothetical protein
MAWRLKGGLGRRAHLAGPCLWAILIAVLCCLAVCDIAEAQSPKDYGIGGTGHQPGEGNGIGGTGQPQQTATGIVGTVTGFGSILVNGFEIDYSAETPTKSDLNDVPDARSIRVGQVVEIEAAGEGKRLRARRIAVRYEVEGPIESIDRASGNIRVLGQTVAAGQSIIGTSQQGSLSDLAVGDTVKVSGLRRADGAVAASRIDKAAAGSPAWLRGRVDNAQDRAFTLSGVRIAGPAFDQGLRPAPGEEVAVFGVYSAGTFSPAKITRLPVEPFAGRIAHLSIEGFVRDRNGNGRFIGGLNLGDGGTSAKLRSGDRVIVDGRIGDRGRFIPASVQPPRFNPAARQQGGRAGPFDRRGRQDSRAPSPGHPDLRGARGGRWMPRHEMHRDGRRWQNRGSPRRGRYRR